MADTAADAGGPVGRIDGVALGRLYGWAWDRGTGRAPRIGIEIDGTLVAELTPATARPDLAEAFGTDGRCGFAWGVPPAFSDAQPRALRLLGPAGEVLHIRPAFRIVSPAEALFRAWKREALRHGYWALRSWQREGSVLSGEGVSVPPHGIGMPIILRVDGRPATTTWRRRQPLPLLTDPMGLAGVFETPRFHFRLDHAGIAEAATLRLSLGGRGEGAFDPSQDCVLELVPPPAPPEALRRRVHGGDELAGFEQVGGNAAHVLRAAIEARTPGGFGALPTVLDWGCGCARVGRYLARWITGAYVGVDPDPEAIAFCRAAIPEGTFHVIGTDPPLPLADGSIDCAIGVSVFTHLSEARQHAWLAELARVVRPGGLLLASTFGHAAWLLQPRPVEDFLRWQQTGFADFGPSEDLAGVIADPEAYRGVSHHPAYIHAQWSQHFAVLEVAVGALGGYQDLAILRRRR